MSGFNFVQITGQSKFRAWKTWKKNEYVIMKVEGFSPNKKNSKYMDITGKMIEHNFQQSDWNKDDRVSVNGTTGTQKFLTTVTAGEEIKSLIGKVIKLLYCGSETVKTGEWAGSQTHVVEGFLAGAPTADVVAEAQDLVDRAKSVL